MLPDEVLQRLADRGALGLDLAVLAGEAPQGGGNLDGDAHSDRLLLEPRRLSMVSSSNRSRSSERRQLRASSALPLLHGNDEVGEPRPGVLAVELAGLRRMVRVGMVVAHDVEPEGPCLLVARRARSRG